MFILTTFRPCEGCIYVASGASEMDERISTLKRSIKEYGYKVTSISHKGNCKYCQERNILVNHTDTIYEKGCKVITDTVYVYIGL